MSSEKRIQQEIRLALPAIGCTAWRANVGRAWTGNDISRFPDGSVLIRDARPFTSGLPPGFSDLFGIVHDSGRFFAIEAKSPRGKLTSQQEKFIEFIKSHNGIAGAARSAEEAADLILSGKR